MQAVSMSRILLRGMAVATAAGAAGLIAGTFVRSGDYWGLAVLTAGLCFALAVWCKGDALFDAIDAAGVLVWTAAVWTMWGIAIVALVIVAVSFLGTGAVLIFVLVAWCYHATRSEVQRRGRILFDYIDDVERRQSEMLARLAVMEDRTRQLCDRVGSTYCLTPRITATNCLFHAPAERRNAALERLGAEPTPAIVCGTRSTTPKSSVCGGNTTATGKALHRPRDRPTATCFWKMPVCPDGRGPDFPVD
jgi:hypothetical protein